MNNLDNILRSFESINLEEMDKVKLMDRIDTKFVYPVEQVTDILHEAKKQYKILEIEDKRIFLYESLYLDTFDDRMFLDHHNGYLNRYKVRFRNYVDSGNIFLEVKFKTNKGRTIKKRIKRKNIDKLDSEKVKKFIEKNSPYLYDRLEPKMWCVFSRLTLVHKSINERVTLDLNLNYRNEHEKRDLSFISIIEVKQDLYGENSDLRDILLSHRIHPAPFSKYCTGRILLDRGIKKNRFKNRLISLNKLHHDNRLVHLIS